MQDEVFPLNWCLNMSSCLKFACEMPNQTAPNPIALNCTVWQPALFLSSGKEAPNLVDPLDRAILNQWTPRKE